MKPRRASRPAHARQGAARDAARSPHAGGDDAVPAGRLPAAVAAGHARWWRRASEAARRGASAVAVAGAAPLADELRAPPRPRAEAVRAAARSGDRGRRRGRASSTPLVDVRRRADRTRPATAECCSTRPATSRAQAERAPRPSALARALARRLRPRFDVQPQDIAPRRRSSAATCCRRCCRSSIVLMVLLGAFYPAIDVTAGERERGTLETMLSAPIAALRPDAGQGAGGARARRHHRAAQPGVDVADPGPGGATWRRRTRRCPCPGAAPPPPAWSCCPRAFLFASLFVARRLARAQLQGGAEPADAGVLPVHRAVAAGGAGRVPAERRGGARARRQRDAAGARHRARARRTLGAPRCWCWARRWLYGALALALAARLYDSERFLAAATTPERAGARRGRGDGARAAPDGRRPPGDALALFAIAFLLLYFVFMPLQARQLVRGLLASQWVGLLGLVAVLRARRRRRARRGASALRAPPSLASVLGAILIGLRRWVVVGLLGRLDRAAAQGGVEQLRRALPPEDGARPARDPAPGRGDAGHLRGGCCSAGRSCGAWPPGLPRRGRRCHRPAVRPVPRRRLAPAAHAAAGRRAVVDRAGAADSLVPAMVAHFVNNASCSCSRHREPGRERPGRLAGRASARLARRCGARRAARAGGMSLLRDRTGPGDAHDCSLPDNSPLSSSDRAFC